MNEDNSAVALLYNGNLGEIKRHSITIPLCVFFYKMLQSFTSVLHLLAYFSYIKESNYFCVKSNYSLPPTKKTVTSNNILFKSTIKVVNGKC